MQYHSIYCDPRSTKLSNLFCPIRCATLLHKASQWRLRSFFLEDALCEAHEGSKAGDYPQHTCGFAKLFRHSITLATRTAYHTEKAAATTACPLPANYPARCWPNTCHGTHGGRT